MTQESVHSALRDPSASRTLFGASTVPWAHLLHEVDDNSWLALSGSGKPDYNIGLVHGTDPSSRVGAMLDEIQRAGVPSILMLAGAGLAGGQALADRGWVCLGSMPFMARDSPDVEPEEDVRRLTADDLEEARELASAAFGVGEEVAGLAYDESMLDRPDALISGLTVDGRLASVVLGCGVAGVSTGWGLATAPGRRRAGFASRIIAGTLALDRAERGPSLNLCLATPMGKPLYDALGFQTIEYWQTWSRPRWVLGGS